jgi:sulfite reductase beta subunit-like hemoprotein
MNSGLTTLSLPAVQSLDAIGHKQAFTLSSIQNLYLPGISSNAYAKAWADFVELPAGCTIHFSDGDVVYPGLVE